MSCWDHLVGKSQKESAGLLFSIAAIGIACMIDGLAAQPTNLPLLEDRLNNPTYLRHLDEASPWLAEGAPAPGRSVSSGQSSRWEGELSWRSRQGPAVVVWQTGRPNAVFDALYPDGSRGNAQLMLDHGWRRLSPDRTHWIYGAVELRPDDVVFTDGVQPRYSPPPERSFPDLERDLGRDSLFLADLQEPRFARGVYATLRNTRFRRHDSTRVWLCGDRQAARVVAGLRGRGESYQDFFLDYDFEGQVPSQRAETIQSLERTQLGYRQVFEKLPGDIASKIAEDAQAEGGTQAAEFQRTLAEMIPLLEKKKARVFENADVFDKVEAHLTRLGWHLVTASEARADQLAALRAIRQFELRSEGARPEWSSALRQPSRAAGSFRMVKKLPDGASDEERELASGPRCANGLSRSRYRAASRRKSSNS